VAKAEGTIRVDRPRTFFPFVKRQIVWVGNEAHPIWFPPEDFERNTGLGATGWARRGEDLIKARIVTGDHLFVDRLSYNFRRPKRGEIVVFETAGIPAIERNSVAPRIPPDQFYIKRLVGLGGETLSIGANRHVRVDGLELSASTPRFENIYTFDVKNPVRDSVYSGHAPQGKLFSPQSEFKIRPNHYMVMGDNTYSSLDSRMWGDFPREYMIGKAFFVYWPILGRDKGQDGRFGWGFR
jgi:signal peptidase I